MTDTDQAAQAESRPHTGRKVYLVPMVLDVHEAPEGYAERVEAYWREVGEHVSRLEARYGAVRKIYHESLPVSGEEGLKIIERVNPNAHRMLDRKQKKGAQLVNIEDQGLLQEAMDWGRCLAVISSPTVFRQVSAAYQEANRKRFLAMARRLAEDLQDEEVALLVVEPEHALQFPPDVQVFFIAPPSLDEINRLLRDHAQKEQREEQSEA